VNRRAQTAILFLVGATALWVSMTDIYLRYVKSGLRPFLFAAGVILIVAASAMLWYERRRYERPPVHPAGEHPPSHAHHGPRVAWLLVLPLFALVVVTPPALGSYTADRTGTGLQPPPGFPALPTTGPLTLTLDDYATRAVYDHGNSLGNRQITVVGFVTVGQGGAPYLTRMVLNCCAADALPIKVGMTGQVPAGLRPDTWLEVTGTYTDRHIKDDVNDGPIPFIDVSQATQVAAPPDQYGT
jgi:uncharacterized repeat protein (TIGR03943 family)